MENVLEINNLSKHYGPLRAVDQLNLTIPKGKVFGLLGPNGSGKTTTLGMILDVINPTSGTISWFGEGNSHHLRKRIGSILETPVFYPYMSGYNNLLTVAKIKEVPEEKIEEVLQKVNLTGRENDPFKTYSLGMKQRLAIAAALLSDPEVLIFDEPTNGLDPQGIADIRKLIVAIANEGKTIILASHLLDEVQRVCDFFAVLRRGQLVHVGPVADVKNEISTAEIAAADMDQLRKSLSEIYQVSKVSKEGSLFIIEIEENFTLAELNARLFEEGIAVNHLTMRAKNLEQQFLEILAQNPS